MRVEVWNPEALDLDWENISMERMTEAAEWIADQARRKLTPKNNISRPVYKRGPYAGQPWTAREAGALKKTIRVRQKRSKSGKPLRRPRDVRVYAGNYLVYYARIYEYHTEPFLRPAFWNSHQKIRQILGVK